jgi:hypothetical protein
MASKVPADNARLKLQLSSTPTAAETNACTCPFATKTPVCSVVSSKGRAGGKQQFERRPVGDARYTTPAMHTEKQISSYFLPSRIILVALARARDGQGRSGTDDAFDSQGNGCGR